jgi:hypothetical protein
MDQSVENAIRFISDALCENPKADKVKLIEAASERFDLNPMQEEHLYDFYIYSAIPPGCGSDAGSKPGD